MVVVPALNPESRSTGTSTSAFVRNAPRAGLSLDSAILGTAQRVDETFTRFVMGPPPTRLGIRERVEHTAT
jgi:hypothetical protein